jgi:multisubunit Na+/H+ antiporter MnhG subunit
VSVAREVLVFVLLGVAAVVTVISAVGLLAMRDPLQRLHFMAPPATSAFLVLFALAVDGAGPAALIKGSLVAVLLSLINGIVTHATARAVFVHDRDRWPPRPGEARVVDGEEEGS